MIPVAQELARRLFDAKPGYRLVPLLQPHGGDPVVAYYFRSAARAHEALLRLVALGEEPTVTVGPVPDCAVLAQP